MTRSMPEPPAKYQLLGPMVIVWEGGNGYYYHPSLMDDKHLTDAECAAHEWQADAELERAARNLDDDYYNPHRFRLRAEYERRLDEWDTWVEFTLRPHALEEA